MTQSGTASDDEVKKLLKSIDEILGEDKAVQQV
jgi:hypothetical protein